jgi:hypothetical protein
MAVNVKITVYHNIMLSMYFSDPENGYRILLWYLYQIQGPTSLKKLIISDGGDMLDLVSGTVLV